VMGCWLMLYVLAPAVLFVPRVGVPLQKLPNLTPIWLHAQDPDAAEPASAEIEKLKAELELAQARAAAAEAKAALAAAQTQTEPQAAASVAVPSSPTLEGGDLALEPEVLEPELDLSAYSESERRPAQFLFGREGSNLFDLLDQLENIPDAGTTVLDEVLRAWFMAVYQLSAASGSAILPDTVPETVKTDIKELGGAVDPDVLATLLLEKDKGGDWRPFMKGLGKIRLSNIMANMVNWTTVFPDPVNERTGLSTLDSKARVIDFLASEALRESGTWSNSEADAAERLISQDPKLARVFSRIDGVKQSIAENIRRASIAPIVGLIFLIAAVAFFCNGLLSGSGGGGGDGNLVPDQSQLQGLPLVGLEK